MRATEITTLVSVGRPTLAPDASFVVFATSRPDISADRAVGQLWRIDLPDGAPRRITGGVADTSPQLSPDGKSIAFLRHDARGVAQIFVVAAVGGEPVQATDAASSVTELAWSPDGGWLAFVARVPEKGRYATVPGLDAAAEPPRSITGIRWHANGVGYILDRLTHVFVIAAPRTDAEPSYDPAPQPWDDGERPTRTIVAADARALTVGGATSYSGIAYSADGSEVVAIAEDHDRPTPDLRSRVMAVAVDGSHQRETLGVEANLAVTAVAVGPGDALAVLAHGLGAGGQDFVAPGTGLWLVENGSARPLTDAQTCDLGESGSHTRRWETTSSYRTGGAVGLSSRASPAMDPRPT